ncbi:MAG: S8 family serine peptidase, partial [Planctomycetes bacterium]|nr:S8 family serine peptidase [Planctomycetota bacterium]
MPVLLAVCAPRLLATQAGAASVRDGQSQREGQVAWRGGGETLTTCDATEIRAVLQYAVQQDRRHVLVLLDGPASAARRAEFADAGLTLLAYLGADTYFASVAAGGGVETLHNLGEVRAVGAIRRDWKLHPLLADGETPSWAFVTRTKPADEESLVATCVLFHADVYLAGEAERVVWHHRARIRSRLRSVNGLVIELPRGQISALADEDAVQWIEPPLPRLTELNDSNRALTGAAIAQDPPYELNGSGVTVLVFDGKAAFPTHPDFGGRLTVRDASGNSNHATHVAGTIGGDGLASGGLYRGMAPAVTLESYGFEMDGGLQWGFLYTDPGDIERDYAEAITLYGADISNNSIGTNTASNGFPCEWEGDYGLTGMVIDGIVRGSLTGAPFRVVWAAGNERSSGRCGTTYHTTAPPACAKNHITVGAVNSNDDTMTAFSSWGPTDDGRIKPDVCGPGCQSDEDEGVTSCKGDGTYMTACGTSMSAPTVCGLGALLLQDYRRQYPGQPDFRNATLKALLAQTAVDLGHPGPDYKFGYGSVRVAREDGFRGALDVLRSGDFVEGELDQGDVWAFTVVVNPGDWELRATLAWDDEPGTPNVDPV